jgi:DNA-directed RNA polymerase subunit RPC12/RpoP
MADVYECFTCRRVFLLTDSVDKSKCPSCGGTNGRVISAKRVKQGMEAGYISTSIRTGKRAKKKRRYSKQLKT